MAKRQSKIKSLDDYVTENVDVIQNKLLGDYNSKGCYCIEQRITNELIKLPKTIKESYNSDIFCTSKTRNGEVVDFKISVTNDVEKGEDVAVLEVLEGVAKQGGKSVQMIKTVIGKYIGEDNADFTQKALKYYNVSVSGVGQEVVEYEDKNINNRKKFLTQLDELSYDAFNKAYKDYYNSRLKVLKHEHNTYSKDVMDMIKEDYDNPALAMFLKDKKYKNGMNYKAMNETMDNAVRYYADCPQYKVSNQIFDQKTDKPFDKFRNAMQTIKDKMLDNIYDMMGIDHNPEMRAEFEDYTNSGISNMFQFIVERRAEKDGLNILSDLFGKHRDREIEDIPDDKKIKLNIFPVHPISPVKIVDGKPVFDAKPFTQTQKERNNSVFNSITSTYSHIIEKSKQQVTDTISSIQEKVGDFTGKMLGTMREHISGLKDYSTVSSGLSTSSLKAYPVGDISASNVSSLNDISSLGKSYDFIDDLSTTSVDISSISDISSDIAPIKNTSSAVELLTTQRIAERGGYSMTRQGA